MPSDESSKVDRGGGVGDEGRTIVGKAGHFHGYADLMTSPEPEEWPLRAAFGDGFTFTSPDDEYQLRVRVLDQTDFKDFIPNNQVPATSGLYIPRVRFYFEGQLTKLFEYEVSIQRSVDGVWDLLDGNVNVLADPRFQVRFGRMLLPYSYDWYDHLEQFFITPERGPFPAQLRALAIGRARGPRKAVRRAAGVRGGWVRRAPHRPGRQQLNH